MKLSTFFTIFFITVFSSSIHAQPKLSRTSVTLTFVNHSNETLSYTGVTDTDPENIFLVSPKIILPGKKVTVTSVTNNANGPDLSGNLQFHDTRGEVHTLHVTDPRQMHFEPTTFWLGKSSFLTSNVKSRLEFSGTMMVHEL